MKVSKEDYRESIRSWGVKLGFDEEITSNAIRINLTRPKYAAKWEYAISSLYAASKSSKKCIPLSVWAEAVGMYKRDFRRCYRQVLRQGGHSPAVCSNGYVEYAVSKLGLSAGVKKVALLNLQVSLSENNHSCPAVQAALAVYVSAMGAGEWRTQREIADVMGITDISIRKCAHEMVGGGVGGGDNQIGFRMMDYYDERIKRLKVAI